METNTAPTLAATQAVNFTPLRELAYVACFSVYTMEWWNNIRRQHVERVLYTVRFSDGCCCTLLEMVSAVLNVHGYFRVMCIYWGTCCFLLRIITSA